MLDSESIVEIFQAILMQFLLREIPETQQSEGEGAASLLEVMLINQWIVMVDRLLLIEGCKQVGEV